MVTKKPELPSDEAHSTSWLTPSDASARPPAPRMRCKSLPPGACPSSRRPTCRPPRCTRGREALRARPKALAAVARVSIWPASGRGTAARARKARGACPRGLARGPAHEASHKNQVGCARRSRAWRVPVARILHGHSERARVTRSRTCALEVTSEQGHGKKHPRVPEIAFVLEYPIARYAA